MGKITAAKLIYDQLAGCFFKAQGWQPFIIDLTGEWVADLIAVNNNHIAIIEVKSVCEETCSKTYDDTKNLSDKLPSCIYTHLSQTRRNIFEFFPNRIQKNRSLIITRFYAVSVACQLYRYFHEIEFLTSVYARKMNRQLIANINQMIKIPYFVVPLEFEREVNDAMNLLKTNKYITSFALSKDTRICVLNITY